MFHWHIVDDQSFPYESYTFPTLSELVTIILLLTSLNFLKNSNFFIKRAHMTQIIIYILKLIFKKLLSLPDYVVFVSFQSLIRLVILNHGVIFFLSFFKFKYLFWFFLGKAIPILTPCYTNKSFDGSYGPIDPSNEATYVFLKNFIKEIIDVFPDKYIHLGGDEVDFGCWSVKSSYIWMQ